MSDAAKAWGKGFVLWFEPERVYEGTRIDREHPGWVKALPGSANRLAGESRSRTPSAI